MSDIMQSYWFHYTGWVLIHPRHWDLYLSLYGACGTVTMRKQS